MKRQPRQLILASAKLILAVAALVILGLLTRRYNCTFAEVTAKLRQYDPLPAGLALTVGYALASIIPIPLRDILKFAAAQVFGFLASTLIIWTGEIIAAAACFWIARLAGKDFIDQLFGARLATFNAKLKGAGWRTVAWLRVLPITPYRQFNFAAGLVDLRFGPYLAGSALGVLVRTAIMQALFTRLASLLVVYQVTLWQFFLASIAFVLTMGLGFWWYVRRGNRTEVKPDEP